jgi:hypothetical protein
LVDEGDESVEPPPVPELVVGVVVVGVGAGAVVGDAATVDTGALLGVELEAGALLGAAVVVGAGALTGALAGGELTADEFVCDELRATR